MDAFMKRTPLLLAMLFMGSTLILGLTPLAHAQNVIITGMDDYNFGTYTIGSGTQTQVQANCVGKTAGNKSWDATIVGGGTGGAFTLNDGTGNTVAFGVRRIPNPTFTSGVTQGTNQADNNAPLDCNGTDNQDFEISIDGTLLDALPAGTYTGFIDITAAP